MYIDDQQWKDIVAESKNGVDRLNARAIELGLKDVFRFSSDDRGGCVVIVCERREESMHEARRLARDTDTGAVLFSEISFSIGESWLGRFTARHSIPERWELADAPASEIVKTLKLLQFFGVVRAEPVPRPIA